MKYYCDSSLNSDEKWKHLLNNIVKISDTVEFNVLQMNYADVLDNELLKEGYSIMDYPDGKLYSSGKCIQFPLTENVKNFVLLKSYADWYNFCIEDPSFRSGGKELLATVTHENYVIMLLSEKQREELNIQGFEFEIEWNHKKTNQK
jgi:hypothetical protein